MKTISIGELDISHTTGRSGLDLTSAARCRTSWLEAS